MLRRCSRPVPRSREPAAAGAVSARAAAAFPNLLVHHTRYPVYPSANTDLTCLPADLPLRPIHVLCGRFLCKGASPGCGSRGERVKSDWTTPQTPSAADRRYAHVGGAPYAARDGHRLSRLKKALIALAALAVLLVRT